MTVKENGEIQDRIRGCMFGGAVGDALGYPVEFLVEEQIKKAGKRLSRMTLR